MFNRKTLIRLLVGILLIEPALRMFAISHFDRSVIWLTPFRMDGIAAGSLLALATESRLTFPRAGWATLILTVLFFVLPHSPDDLLNSPLLPSLVAAIGFCLLAWVLPLERGFAYNLLSSGPLAYIGRISYGMYLLDMPVVSLMQKVVHAGFNLAVIRKMLPIDLALIVAIASLSYRFVEKPLTDKAKTLVDSRSTPIFTSTS
jgi:peptidoglycan/LPS O-acetylase OafA/YrhL